jgi:hypothetical protein
MSRFDVIMAQIDAWAENAETVDCRDEAVEEVEFILNSDEYSDWTDEQIVEAGIQAWSIAE